MISSSGLYSQKPAGEPVSFGAGSEATWNQKMLRGLLRMPRACCKGFQSPAHSFLWPQALPHFIQGSCISRSSSISVSGTLSSWAPWVLLRGQAEPSGSVVGKGSASSLLLSVHQGTQLLGQAGGKRKTWICPCAWEQTSSPSSTPFVQLTAGQGTLQLFLLPCGSV